MDCNNNDGTNYIYQMQQTMNSALSSSSAGGNSMGPTTGLSGLGQPPPQQYGDKKPFDLNQSLASNSQPQYQQLNGHHHTPVNSSSTTQFYSQQSTAAAPSTGSGRQPAASPYSNSDFNNFNHPTSNFYGHYGSGAFNQPLNHSAHVNPPHPVNHSTTTPSSSASSVNPNPLNHPNHPNHPNHHHHSAPVNHPNHHHQPPATTNQLMKPERSIPLPYEHHHVSSGGTNPTTIYNHLHSNHHLPSHGQLPGNPHHPLAGASNQLPNQQALSSAASVLNNHHHPHHNHPSSVQPANTQHSSYQQHSSQNTSSSYHQQHASHHQSIQHPFNSGSPAVNSTAASRTVASPSSTAAAFNPHHHHPNYYNFSPDPWKAGYPPAQQLASSASSPPQSSSMLQAQQQQPNHSNNPPVQIVNSSQLTNLNNSANLSQPYANMHISNSMNSSLNSSIGNGSIASSSYMQPMNSGNYSHYPGGQVESNHQAVQPQNHHHPHHQFLASPPPHSDFNNSMAPLHQQQQQQQHQYHQQHQQTPSSPHHPNLTVVVVNNNSNSSNQRPKGGSKPKNSNNSMNNSLNSSTGKNEQQKRQSSLSEIDETLDAVVNCGLKPKPKRKRNKSKASKEKGGKEPKATSAYALFFKKVQNDLKKQSPDMKFGDISRTVAHKWGCLPEEDKQGYRLITEKDRKSRISSLAKEKAIQISETLENLGEPRLEPAAVNEIDN